MIVPIYIADVLLWSANWGDYTQRYEEVSFDPIPMRVVEYDCGSRHEISRGDKPRVWVKTPALSRIDKTPMYAARARPKDHPMEFGKVLLLSGEATSPRDAYLVLWCARNHKPGFSLVEAPQAMHESSDNDSPIPRNYSQTDDPSSESVENIRDDIRESSDPHVMPIYGRPGQHFDYLALSFVACDGLEVLYRCQVPAGAVIRDGKLWIAPWRTADTAPWMLLIYCTRKLDGYGLIEGPAYRREMLGTGPLAPVATPKPVSRRPMPTLQPMLWS